MYCTQCGKENNEGSSFCISCGTKLSTEVRNTNPTKQFFAQVVKKPLFLAIAGVLITIVAYAVISQASGPMPVAESKKTLINPFNKLNVNRGKLYFRMIYYVGMGFKPEFFYFLPGNRIYKSVPKGGLNNFDFEETKKHEPYYTGNYEIKEGSIFITWDDGNKSNYAYENKDGQLYIGGLYANKVKILEKNQKLEGKWICLDSVSSNSSNPNNAYVGTSTTLAFHLDGTFEEKNVAAAIGEVKEDSVGGGASDNHSGTYQFFDNTLVLHYSDGRAEYFTAFFPFGIKKEIGKPEFINIDGNMYHLEK